MCTRRTFLAVLLGSAAAAPSALAAGSAWRLKSLRRGVTAPAESIDIALARFGWQPLDSFSAVAAELDSIPDGNTVEVDATGMTGAAEWIHTRRLRTIATLSPGAGYNGTMNSGYAAGYTDQDGNPATAAPTDPTRTLDNTTGKPVLVRVWPPGREALVPGDLLIVDFDARDADADVKLVSLFWTLEGGTLLQTSPERGTYPVKDGRGVWGFATGYAVEPAVAAMAGLASNPQGFWTCTATYSDGSLTYQRKVVGRMPTSGTDYNDSNTDFYSYTERFNRRISIQPSHSVAAEKFVSAVYPAPCAIFRDLTEACEWAAGHTTQGVTAMWTGTSSDRIVVTLDEAGDYDVFDTAKSFGAHQIGFFTITNGPGIDARIKRTTWSPSWGYYWYCGQNGVKIGSNLFDPSDTTGSLSVDFAMGGLPRNQFSGSYASMPLCWDGLDTYNGAIVARMATNPDRPYLLTPTGRLDFPILPKFARGVTITGGGGAAGVASALNVRAYLVGTNIDIFTGARCVQNYKCTGYGDIDKFPYWSIPHYTFSYSGAGANWRAQIMTGSEPGDTSAYWRLSVDGAMVMETPALNSYTDTADFLADITAQIAATPAAAGVSVTLDPGVTLGDRITDRHPVMIGAADSGTLATGVSYTAESGFTQAHQDADQTQGGLGSNMITRGVMILDAKYMQTMGGHGGTGAAENLKVCWLVDNDRVEAAAGFDDNLFRNYGLKGFADPGSSWSVTSSAPHNSFNAVVNVVAGAFTGTSVLSKVENLRTLGNYTSFATLWDASANYSPSGSMLDLGNLVVKPAEFDLHGNLFEDIDANGPKAIRKTTLTTTKQGALDSAIYCDVEAAIADAGSVVFSWHVGAGDTGVVRQLTVNAAAP